VTDVNKYTAYSTAAHSLRGLDL